MTSKEFILWLKGFSEGVHQYNITPMQWDAIKDKLSEINDGPAYNTHPPYVDGKGHPNPYYFTTTPNAYRYPSGSSISYTSTVNELCTTRSPDEIIKHHNED